MKLSVLIALMLALALVSSGSVYLIYKHSDITPPALQKVPYYFKVNSTIGFDVGNDLLRLGQLTPGSQSSRNLSIKDTVAEITGKPSVDSVTFMAKGSGSEWITFDPPIVTLPGDVSIIVSPPADAKIGVYKGEILVIAVKKTE